MAHPRVTGITGIPLVFIRTARKDDISILNGFYFSIGLLFAHFWAKVEKYILEVSEIYL